MPKTIVKDQATAEFAARNLEKGADLPGQVVEPNTPKPKSTSEKLFPEFITDDGAVINRPIKAFEDASKVLPVTATPTPTTQLQTPPTVTPTPPVYITEDDLKGKMAKLKVDGVEQDVPADSLLKTNQLERHLNTQLMNVAEERRKLELERSALQRPITPAQTPEAKPAAKPDQKKAPEIEMLEDRLAKTQANLEALYQTIRPQIQDAGVKMLDKRVKEAFGADDYMAYHDKIKELAKAEASKPEVSNNPQVLNYLDSSEYYFQTYKDMKLRDTISKPPTAPVPAVAPNAPVLTSQTGAPIVMNNQGQPVSIPAFESSGGVPSKASPEGDWASKAQTLFDAARKTGTQDAWMAYYKFKSQAS